MTHKTFDNILATHLKPMGKWQWIIIMITTVCAQFPFIFFGTLAHDPPPHRCFINFMDNGMSNFTMDQVRKLAIPDIPASSPVDIGQDYEPCKQYDLPYKKLSKFSFEQAMRYRRKLEQSHPEGLHRIPCSNGYVYDNARAVYKHPVGEEFGLVCEKSPMVAFITSIYMPGMTAGLLIAGYVADWLGRKPALMLFGLSHLFVAFSISLSTSASVYALMRFLLALTCNAHGIVCFILCMEITDNHYRSILNTVFLIYYTFFGRGAFTLMAFLIQKWRHLALAMGCCLVLVIFYPTSLITESPRWLLSRGRTAQANALIARAIKINRGKDYYERILNSDPHAFLCKSSVVESKKSDMKKISFLSRIFSSLSVLFMTPKVRFRFIFGTLLFSFQVILYYGVSFYAIHVKGNPYFISFLEGFMGIPAAAFLYFLYSRYLRRGPMMSMHALSTLVCLLCAIMLLVKGSGSLAVVVLANIVICFEETAFNMLYVYLPEVFPTEIRNTGFSSASAVSRSAGMLASYIESLDKSVWLPLPMLIFSVLGLTSVVWTYMLPETKGESMIDTVAELEGRDKHFIESDEAFWSSNDNDRKSLIKDGDV